VIEFAPLSSVDPRQLTALASDPQVIRHMPLSDPTPMGPEELRDWIEGKESISREHGYGPQAILIDGAFAGWGGLEPDGDGASISLVLFPAFWGRGRQVLDVLLRDAFERLGVPYVLVEFPPTRTRIRGLLSLGFRRVGDREIFGEPFKVYRLDAPPPEAERDPSANETLAR
jgi:[ribosomal protein S5]-alanine N-acetyltransferase